MKTITLAAAALLSGCATSNTTFGPDGKQAFVINCSGAVRQWGMCYEKAGDLCGARGYTIINELSAGSAIVGPLGGGAGMQKNLVIQCK